VPRPAGAPPQAPGAPPRSAGPARTLPAWTLPATALSLVTVPLVAGGRVIGVLAIAGAEPDRFRERDADRLQRLADITAPALERARLDELERGSRARARFLAEAGDLLAVSLDREKVLALGAQLVIANLAAWCAFLLADGEAAPRLAYAGHASSARAAALDWLLRRIAPPARQARDRGDGGRGDGGRGEGWRWQLALPAGSETMPPGVTELLADQAWCFPLVAAGRKLGLLVIGGPGTGRLPAEVAELAEGLARKVAAALDGFRDGPGAGPGGSGLALGGIPWPARDMPASVLRSC
jgi:GAF domain-containing protein